MSTQDKLLVPLHVSYIQSLGNVSTSHSFYRASFNIIQNKDDLAYHLTAHLRMNAIYWGLTALCIMGHKDALDREDMIEYVMSCWDDEAGLFPRPFSPVWLDLSHPHSQPSHSPRWLRCTPGSRCTYSLYVERDSDPRHTRRAR